MPGGVVQRDHPFNPAAVVQRDGSIQPSPGDVGIALAPICVRVDGSSPGLRDVGRERRRLRAQLLALGCPGARKVLGWRKICMLTHVFLWEYS